MRLGRDDLAMSANQPDNTSREKEKGENPLTLPPDTQDLRPQGWQTHSLTLGTGVLPYAEAIFTRCFGASPARIIADGNTWAAAGAAVHALLAQRRVEPLILQAAPTVQADMQTVQRVRQALASTSSVQSTPVAVGSGTINDLVKLAAHQLGRPYMVVATAPSMDGYTAFGASITREGSKQTFDCPAPRALLADMDVIAAAPAEMAATGYADLLAKVAAGADWILADALGIEPIHPQAWQLLQLPLRQWLAQPQAIRQRKREPLRQLMQGLLASGLAMQVVRSSRPASGAEHQFSHLWDMENHQHQGRAVPHGSKVGIGTLASCGLYEGLLSLPLEKLDVAQRCRAWPAWEEVAKKIITLHPLPALREKALLEMRAKYIDAAQLQQRLEHLRACWPQLREKLARQLLPTAQLRQMLRAAGAPAQPQEIGLPLPRLRESYDRAAPIRRRYTIFDLAGEIGQWEHLIDQSFAPGGVWGDLAR